MRKGLKTIRIVISLTVTAAFSALLATNSIAAAQALGWSVKLQIVPLLISGATVQLLLWLALTLIFGRIYCSTACPLGTLQDVFHGLRHISAINRRLPQMRFAPPNNKMRLSMLAATLILMLLGANAAALIIEPANIFTKFVRLATDIRTISVTAGSFTVSAFLLIAILSVRRGRIWCNTMCPLGTALGIISNRSHLKIYINPDYCTACGKCQDKCKAQAINLAELKVDASRCILCFNCIAVCNEPGAISYTNSPGTPASPLFQQIQKQT